MLFCFYGTLLDGADNPVARAIHALLDPVGPARVRGALHAVPDALGWFPALVDAAAPDGWITGRLYKARGGFTAGDLARMDAYEDFDPARLDTSLYVRRAVVTEDGGIAQVYVFNQPLPTGSLPIAHGDFRRWLAETRKPQFTGLRDA